MSRKWWRRKRVWIPMTAVLGLLLLPALFAFNGLWLAHNESPVVGKEVSEHHLDDSPPAERITILSYNIAKGSVHKTGLKFRSDTDVRQRINRIAELIRDEKPDVAFISEVILHCDPCPVDQVQVLARETGLVYWAFGENYNFGLPSYRIVGGNAILSRVPIEAETNMNLAGRQPFYVTKNNRRLLWGRIRMEHGEVLVGAVHNDSYSLNNNLAQTKQMLKYASGREAIIAGDFNARPHEPPMQSIRRSKQFTADFDGPKTFPRRRPDQRIDFILAPEAWRAIEHRVIQSDASDHLPIVSVYRLPQP